jgi:Holliday junction resolvase RusA-like endonuclease
MVVSVDVAPQCKPRMTQQDKWRKRPAVVRYNGFKKEFVLKCRQKGVTDLPEVFGVIFHIPMPESWSKKKKREMNGRPHQQTPDLDNLIKAVKDALASDDSHVYKYPHAEKRWSLEPSITLIIFDENKEDKDE